MRTNSYDTATRLYQLSTAVPADDVQRIEDAIDHVALTLDIDWLISQSKKELEFRLSPAAFLHQLTEKARAAKKRIVLPEGVEPRTVKAAAICARRGIARCVLLGDPAEVQAVARSQDIELPDNLEILNPTEVRPKYVSPLFEMRKQKGLSMEMAASQLEDNVVLGTMMLALRRSRRTGLWSCSFYRQHHPARFADHQNETKCQGRFVDLFHVPAGTGPGLWRLRRDSGSGRGGLGRYRDPECGLGGGVWDPAERGNDQLFDG